MGLPFYFTDENKGAAFLEDNIVCDMADEQLEELFESGSVFVDGDVAVEMCRRGFGDRLGVNAIPWEKHFVTGECFDKEMTGYCTKQKDQKELVITNENTETMSYNMAIISGERTLLAPAVTCLDRGDGRVSVVYCGTPNAKFNYGEGFSFLNETRKKQFVELLKRANALPIYVDSDNEICLRAGYLGDGSLLAEIICIGFDLMDTVRLYLEKKPESIELMLPDGTTKEVSFKEVGKDIYEIDARVEPMYPVFLIIK
jgi:hypothetical protein